MTCVVAVKLNNRIAIAADSAGVEGDELVTYKRKKVFKIKDLVIGYTDSFRMGQILQYYLDPPEDDFEDQHRYMVLSFVPHVINIFTTWGFGTHHDTTEYKGGTFIVVYKGNIFSIFSDYQVFQSTDDYASVGSGSPYALATMKTILDNTTDLNAEMIAFKALENAEYFSTNVRKPFDMEILDV